MRNPKIVMLATAAIAQMMAAVTAPGAAAQTATPAAPKASDCSAMPYTAERADEAMGLRLKFLGLKPDNSENAADGKPPLIDAAIEREKYKREAASDVMQAVNAVSAVYFCRLAEANPSKVDDLNDARLAFMDDVDLIFDPENFKDAAATTALSNQMKSRCKTKGCPEVPAVLASNQLGKVSASENFTRVEIVRTTVYADIQRIAKADGCWSVVNASILSAPGAYLGALEGVAPVLKDYLKGGTVQVIGLSTMRSHAKAVVRAAGQQSDSVSDIVKKDDKIGSCLTKIASAAQSGAPKDSAADGKKDSTTKDGAGEAKVNVTVGGNTLTLTGGKP